MVKDHLTIKKTRQICPIFEWYSISRPIGFRTQIDPSKCGLVWFSVTFQAILYLRMKEFLQYREIFLPTDSSKSLPTWLKRNFINCAWNCYELMRNDKNQLEDNTSRHGKISLFETFNKTLSQTPTRIKKNNLYCPSQDLSRGPLKSKQAS
jgi:hypothetical protein